MQKIDVDKFVCSLFTAGRFDYGFLQNIQKVLADQGIECKNGSLVDIPFTPAYKVGDWVALEVETERVALQIEAVDNRIYRFTDGSRLDVVNEYCLHRWSLMDVRAGDILALGNDPAGSVIFISNGRVNPLEAYVGFAGPGTELFFDSTCCLANQGSVHPATFSQKDSLFLKIAEAGYEWDPEKLELLLSDEARQTVRQVEPKPVVVSSGGATSASSSRTGCPTDVTEKPVQEEWTTAYVSSKGKSPTIDISFLRAGEKVDNFTISRENARKLMQGISGILKDNN